MRVTCYGQLIPGRTYDSTGSLSYIEQYYFNGGYGLYRRSYSGSVSFTINSDKDLVANFNLNTYTITVNANPAEGGTVEGAGTYDHGATVTLTATANDNFRFIGWMENNEVISSETTYSFTAEANRTLVAKFSSTLYWTADPGDNEDNMTMSATIQIDGVEQFTNTLEVGVFVGDECRGEGFVENGSIFLTVHCDADEYVKFKLYNTLTGETDDIKEGVRAQMRVGSINSPILLHATTTGISGVDGSESEVEAYDLTGRRTTTTQRGITIRRNANGNVRKVIVK